MKGKASAWQTSISVCSSFRDSGKSALSAWGSASHSVLLLSSFVFLPAAFSSSSPCFHFLIIFAFFFSSVAFCFSSSCSFLFWLLFRLVPLVSLRRLSSLVSSPSFPSALLLRFHFSFRFPLHSFFFFMLLGAFLCCSRCSTAFRCCLSSLTLRRW